VLIAGARRKGELARWMAGLRAWDFFVVVFGETHRAGHLFWPAPQAEGVRHPAHALLAVYQAVDDAIGRLLESVNLDDTTLIIVSAHGMAANASQEHFTRPIMDRVNRHFPGMNGGARVNGPRQRSAMRVLREKLPARLQHAIGQLAPSSVRNFVVDRAIASGHDWSHTPALAVLASVTGFVRFNLRGRESRGMLDPDGETFRRYVRWVHDSFKGFHTLDTGAPLVDAITPAYEAFPGPRQAYLPDLIVSWTPVEKSTRIHSARLGAINAERPTGRAGNHHPDGFTIVVERNGERGVAPTTGDILDVKPMVFRRLFAQN
jgi:predicted AlkP superfamily phosphohydrolase/phosphomutase